MLNVKFSGMYLTCDKCHKYMREANVFGEAEFTRLLKRKHFCGECVLKRIKPYAEKHGCKYVF